MKILFCFTVVNGYICSCLRALQAIPGVQLRLLAYRADRPGSDQPFSSAVTAGLDAVLLSPQEADDPERIAKLAAAFDPDIVVIPGWFRPTYTQLVYRPELARARFVIQMDTPWFGHLRQRVARYYLRSYLRRLSLVVVAGERSWQYAWRLGVPVDRIRRGAYGVDYQTLAPAYARRTSGPWPRSFLFAGRLSQEKGVDFLVETYRRYREQVRDPWELVVCGTGPLARLLDGQPGVRAMGFVQPADMAAHWAAAGAVVVPSWRDAWPLVIAEGAAAGLPVVCTEACGSSVELIRAYYNGIVTPTGDPDRFATALRWLHDHPDRLPEFGRRSQQLAAAYSAEAWADRWSEWLGELVARRDA